MKAPIFLTCRSCYRPFYINSPIFWIYSGKFTANRIIFMGIIVYRNFPYLCIYTDFNMFPVFRIIISSCETIPSSSTKILLPYSEYTFSSIFYERCSLPRPRPFPIRIHQSNRITITESIASY